MRSRNVSTLVRKYFTAFHARDRKTLQVLLSDDFTFSSPRDDQIRKQAYFETCWPRSEECRPLDRPRRGGPRHFVERGGAPLPRSQRRACATNCSSAS